MTKNTAITPFIEEGRIIETASVLINVDNKYLFAQARKPLKTGQLVTSDDVEVIPIQEGQVE